MCLYRRRAATTTTEVYSNTNKLPLQALLRGCRCIEIDVWDGEPKSPDQPSEQPDGMKARMKSHVHDALDRFRHSKEDAALLAAKDEKQKEELVAMPTPWTSASTLTRAEPRVLHGHTLTKEVPFRDVCMVIKENAFVTR